MAAKLSGGGKKRFDLGQNSEINVTPFVDVMLVLLIIFMVTAPLATVSIKIDIPPAQAPTTPSKPPTYISIANNGQLFVSFATGPESTEMRPTTLETMGAIVGQSLGVANPTTQQVFIRADPHVKYGVFMGVVNRLQIDGYYKIGLISEEVSS
ncbi:MAG TPA: biopolymer transporter ExbD [Caulobacteraceae bacterium]|jgi:biopolymer transport protein ExbD|nr:biopolymer transporter ExbD [Caulobacteraceae bacterium]